MQKTASAPLLMPMLGLSGIYVYELKALTNNRSQKSNNRLNLRFYNKNYEE